MFPVNHGKKPGHNPVTSRHIEARTACARQCACVWATC